MSVINGKIMPPVNITDIQQVLGVILEKRSTPSERIVSGDLGTLICGEVDEVVGVYRIVSRNEINMWAKYKPVVWSNKDTTPAMKADKTWNPSTAAANQWWKSTNGDYGLSFVDAIVSVTIGKNGMVNALNYLANNLIDGKGNGWSYTKPTGGSLQRFRILDFIQYDHNAAKPFARVTTDDVYASVSTVYTVSVGLMRTPKEDIENRDYIVPEDISDYTLYMGFAIFKKSGSTYNAIAWTTNELMEWNGYGINPPDGIDGIIEQSEAEAVTKLKDGETYYVLPFFATAEFPQSSASCSSNASTSNVKLLTLPNVNFVSFTAHQRSTTQTYGKPVLSDTTVGELWNFNTTLYLDSTYAGYSGGNAPNVILAVVNNLWDGTPAEGNNAFYKNYGTVTVGSNERKMVGSTGTKILDSTKTWRVLVWVDGEMSSFALRTPMPDGGGVTI